MATTSTVNEDEEGEMSNDDDNSNDGEYMSGDQRSTMRLFRSGDSREDADVSRHQW